MRKIFILLCVIICANTYAQDFGFGFDDAAGDTASESPVSVKVSGEIAVELLPFIYDFKKKDDAQTISFWDMVSGKLNFTVSGGNIEGFAALNLNANAVSELWNVSPLLDDPAYTPLIFDEAFLRAYIGPVNIEAGLRKLSWGKADSFGPLDVINPIDYSDLTNITDIKASKIARPMIHVSWGMDDGFSKLEAVFIPNFSGHRFAQEGRWAPSQFTNMPSNIERGIFSRAGERHGTIVSMLGFDTIFGGVQNNLMTYFNNNPISAPPSGGLDYFQTGLRYTTTIGPADIGAQYFYGNLFRPGFTIGGVDSFLDDLVTNVTGGNLAYPGEAELLAPQLKYNRYHQIGIDYAQVLLGLNIRSEFAVHLTEDMKGDDGAVRNPFIGWSLGFDRDVFRGVNVNIQGNETIRLFDSKVGDNPVLDCEADTSVTSTRLTLRLSKKFLKDELECKLTGIWGIEDKDGYIIPALVWSIGDMSAELSAGVFLGEKSGELGQYRENSFIKLGLKYTF